MITSQIDRSVLTKALFTILGLLTLSLTPHLLLNLTQFDKMLGFDVDFKRYRWAIIYCSVSAIGALVFGYDNTYYSGILGMQQFKNDYGGQYTDGREALTTSFTSLTTSSIYIGDMVGALISGPLNDTFGRKTVLRIASFLVLAGGIVQVADTHYEGMIVLGRILVGLGVGNVTVTSLL